MPIIQSRAVPAIQAIDLRRVYNTRSSNHRGAAAAITHKTSITALDGVSLTIERGELFGLLGRNGAGKTTLIKILTTLLAPTGGKAFVNGLDVTRNVLPIRQRIAMVSGGEQSGYGVLTVREQLWMFAQFYGVPSREAHRRIDELLVAFDLSNQASQKYTRFPQVCASASTSAVRWSQTRRSSSWMSQLSGWMWRRRAQCANT